MRQKKVAPKSLLPTYRVNEDIHWKGDVRITGNDIESKVLPIEEARKIAQSMELDLIEIQPAARPPIMRIANHEKMMYEMKKKLKKSKTPAQQEKEIQLSVSIAKNDLETKAKHAQEFLQDGHRVKVVLRMKGRELTRREENKRSILEFITMLSDISVPESMPRDEGNKVIVYLKRKK